MGKIENFCVDCTYFRPSRLGVREHKCAWERENIVNVVTGKYDADLKYCDLERKNGWPCAGGKRFKSRL